MIKNQLEKVVNILIDVYLVTSCMTTCPSGVNYMHLIDHGKKYIEKNYERPFFDRT